MTARVTFHRLAERERNEAAQYYDAECPGLGAAFLNEIQHCIQRILDYPEAAAVVAGSVRRRLTRRFP